MGIQILKVVRCLPLIFSIINMGPGHLPAYLFAILIATFSFGGLKYYMVEWLMY